MIRIYAVGKKHEPWVVEGVARYEKRLKKPFDIEWTILPHSSHEGDVARAEESKALLARISQSEHVVLLDERGQALTSPQMSTYLTGHLQRSKPVSFVIGGAYGVDESLHARANAVWKLSDLVFPHQLIRLILTEQLYRSQEIQAGRKYHHE